MTEQQLELREVSVRYGEVLAVDAANLMLEAGQIGCLLGPSGCGKTTLLRAIAGFEPLATGEITLHGQRISGPGVLVSPERRRVGMVFQDFALFPHLSVARNVAFGLKDLAGEARRGRVLEMLDLVGLGGLADRFPHELSGGQQQRVALARALAPAPEILLLDEPFSSLDSQLRESLAREIRDLLKARGVTAILVTHDQQEAFAMSDTIALLDSGRIVQQGSPGDLYLRPVSEFAAHFLGPGRVITVSRDSDRELLQSLGQVNPGEGQRRWLVRPEAVSYSPGSALRATVTACSYRGSNTLVELALEDGQRLSCLAPGQLEAAVGEPLPIRLERSLLVVLER